MERPPAIPLVVPPVPRRARCPGWPRDTAPPDCTISRAMCFAPALPVSECALCGVWLVCVRRDGGRGGRAQLGVEQRCAASPLLPDPPRGTVRAPLRHAMLTAALLVHRARLKPRILPAATGGAMIAYSALSAGALGGPLAAGVAGAGVGCVYLGVPKTQLVDEGPLVVGGECLRPAAGEALGGARGGARAGGAGGLGACGTAVYEQLTVVLSAGIAGGLMGMAFQRAVAAGAATREGKVMTVAGLAGLGVFGMAVQDMAGPTAYKM